MSDKTNRYGEPLKDAFAPLGKVIYYTGVWRLYRNGRRTHFVWRYWHPLTWVLLPLFILFVFCLHGIKGMNVSPHEYGLMVHPSVKAKYPDPFNQGDA